MLKISHPAIIDRSFWDLVQIELKEEVLWDQDTQLMIYFHPNLYVKIVVAYGRKNGIQEVIMKSLFINAIISFTKAKINA